ncbi:MULTISPECIES: carbohydrate ABC transporter permease [Streptomyces]|uniref:Sugar ABC transporter permease n=1 Tax=Streptomyces caniscabiei TaxID=2746961 RepID=A0ABU4MP43_9ACTN|nr:MULTISPECIES: sugar ABC transporter permease [Streptomyces]MBE4734330.1 sugar ABC transporter permease [Streptomyces caniscabiei]MBE4755201.1 sugar ABC transporter permease [Streptomyces caniscabiei]MBE4771180.1 sugar ABC transporter permease [Streptomyces caniscabiei]MBE4783514.1 sugar ABC transporter permease [Streptomyces caniscabiei]MBE4792818.1 sugar ABC transporter permease [Streptomyces caniscabiei]
MNDTKQLSDRRSAHDLSGAATAAPPRARARERRRPSSSQWAAWAFLAPVTLYLALFYAYPLYRNLDLSLRDYTVRSFVDGNAPFTGLANYQKVFDDPTFAPALLHTVVFTAVCLVFQYAIGLALAVFFNQHFRLSTTLRALFLVPWLLPLIVSASTWSWMFNSDSGIVNTALHAVGIGPVNWLTSPDWSLPSVIIANIWIGVPFNLVVLYSGLQSVPGSLYEAAALDGANAWQRFWRITFPLLRPVSAITLLLGLVYTLKVFDIIWIMTKGGPADSSTTFATWSYQLGFGNLLPAFGPGAAVGNLLVVAALVFGLVYVRVQRKQALS